MVIEHIIAGNIIPHNEGAIPLTKESYDVENPQRRTSDFSKTITIPENRITNQIFEHAFDVNVSFLTFDPNKKTSYQIVQDGVIVMDGYCRLVDVVNVDGRIVYKIQATGAVGNIYELIKDKYIADLDFSEFDHTYNAESIAASWTSVFNTYKARVEADGGVVENDACTTAFIDSIFNVGYFYPMIDKGGKTNYDNWLVTEFQPVVFIREIIRKIFDNAGYVLSSSFFDTTLFRSLALMSLDNTLIRGNAAIKERQYSVKRITTAQGPIQMQNLGSGDTSLANSSKLIFNSDAPAPLYNTSTSEYDITTGYFSPDAKETYKVQGTVNFDLNYVESFVSLTFMMNAVYATPSTANVSIRLWLVKEVGGFYSKVAFSQINVTTEFLAQWNNTIGTQSITNITKAFSFGQFEASPLANYMVSVGGINFSNAGSNFGTVVTKDFTFDLNVGSTSSSTLLSLGLKEGETLDLAKALPNMRQSDLLSSIIKRFNLYLEYQNNNDVVIEPRDDYFTSESIDATAMIDRSKEYIVKPLGALTAREYIFTDLEDNDKLNKLYQDTYSETYGTYTFDVDNDFTTATKTISSLLAPSPMQSQSLSNDRIITSAQFEDADGFKTNTAGKPRLLYVGGLLDTTKTWRLEAQSPTPSNYFYDTYPYAGHLDNPYAPTFDLNWGVPKQLYYDLSYNGGNSIEYPNSNCYNVFWSNNINEITDKNSKLLECYVALRPFDYQDFTFRKRYYIDGSYWRLLKIEDYDAMSGETTKCLFLKADPQTLFSGTVGESEGGIGVFDNGDILPSYQGNVEVFNPAVKLNSDDTDVFAGVYANGLFVEDALNLVLPTSILENLTVEFQILPELADNQFYEVTRGYIRLNGTAATTGHKVDFLSDIGGHSFASIPSSFFNTNDNVDNIDINTSPPLPLPFGEGVYLSSSSDMEFLSGTTTLTIQLIYRVITI